MKNKNPCNYTHPIKVDRKNLSKTIKNNVFMRYEGKCCNCGCTNNLEYHHIVPLIYGGLDVESNIVLICKECHYKTHQKVYCKRTSSTRAKRPNAISYDEAKQYIDKYVNLEISLVELQKLMKCEAYKQTLKIPHIMTYMKENKIDKDEFKNIIKKNASAHRNKKNRTGKVICDNRVFNSIKECADFYNVCNMGNWLSGRRPMPQRFQEMGLAYYPEDGDYGNNTKDAHSQVGAS